MNYLASNPGTETKTPNTYYKITDLGQAQKGTTKSNVGGNSDSSEVYPNMGSGTTSQHLQSKDLQACFGHPDTSRQLSMFTDEEARFGG